MSKFGVAAVGFSAGFAVAVMMCIWLSLHHERVDEPKFNLDWCRYPPNRCLCPSDGGLR